MNIDKNSLISAIIREYPAAVDVFERFNMGCASCLGLQSESLEKGCLMHGLDLDEVIAALNAVK
jgi:hybrid cluster-associated redox disulfide protein